MRVMKWGRRTLAMTMVGVLGVSMAASAAPPDPNTGTEDDVWESSFDGEGAVLGDAANKLIHVVVPTEDQTNGGFGYKLDPNHMIANYAATAPDTNIEIAGDATLYFRNKTPETVDEETGAVTTWKTVWSDTSDPITAINKGNADADITVSAYLKQGATEVSFSTNDSFTKETTEEDGVETVVEGTATNPVSHMFMTLQDVNEEYASKVIKSAIPKADLDAAIASYKEEHSGAEDSEAEKAYIEGEGAAYTYSITKSIPNVKDDWYEYSYDATDVAGDSTTIGTFKYAAKSELETAADDEFPSYTFKLRGASNAEADWSGISEAPKLAVVWKITQGEYAQDAYVGWETDENGEVIMDETDTDHPAAIVVGPKASDPTAAFIRSNGEQGENPINKVTVNGKEIAGAEIADGEQYIIPWSTIKEVLEEGEAPAFRIRVEYTDGLKKAADPDDPDSTDEYIMKAYVGTIQ